MLRERIASRFFLTASVLALAACVESPVSLEGPGSHGTGGGPGEQPSSGTGSTKTEDGRTLWKGLEAEFVSACGSCHDVGGIADAPFLAGPDRHQSTVSWPGFVVADAATSRLLTYPRTGTGHPGKDLSAADLVTTLAPKLEAWLEAEAAAVETPEGGEKASLIVPFVPILGFNAVYLSPLGSSFDGMALTFNATQLGKGTLSISNLEMHPSSKTGVHVVHPLFTVFPLSGEPDPDPVDSFSNVDVYFDTDQTGTVGVGTVVLTNWKPDARLSIAFEKLEPFTATGGVITVCDALGKFTSKVKPILKDRCFRCHGGDDETAASAVDMTKLDSDVGAACLQVKTRVDVGEPAASQLFVTTDPNGNAAHPFKFNGDAGDFAAFKSQVTTWIQGEE